MLSGARWPSTASNGQTCESEVPEQHDYELFRHCKDMCRTPGELLGLCGAWRQQQPAPQFWTRPIACVNGGGRIRQ